MNARCDFLPNEPIFPAPQRRDDRSASGCAGDASDTRIHRAVRLSQTAAAGSGIFGTFPLSIPSPGGFHPYP